VRRGDHDFGGIGDLATAAIVGGVARSEVDRAEREK